MNLVFFYILPKLIIFGFFTHLKNKLRIMNIYFTIFFLILFLNFNRVLFCLLNSLNFIILILF